MEGRMKVLVLTNMYPTPELPSSGTFVKEQVDSIIKNGVEIDVIHLQGKRSVLDYLSAFFMMWAKLLTRRYDLVHAHFVFSGIIARLQFLYPVVLTHHSSHDFRGWQAPISRLVTNLIDRTIVMSNEMKEKGRFIRSVVIPCGIDFELFKPEERDKVRQALNLPEEKKLVLFAGDYDRPLKRWDIVQESVKILKEKYSNVELVLLSKKPLDVVPEYMNACDVLVLTSDNEGSPMVIKEAMACNLPIVSVPVGDIPDVIGGTDGCYLCSQEPQDVADKLEIALSYGKRTNGREKISHLEIGAISRRIIDLYQDLIENKRNRWWKFKWLGNKRKRHHQ